jgi:hypothetical protein
MIIRTLEQVAGITVKAAADRIASFRAVIPPASRKYGVGERITLTPTGLANPAGVSWSIKTAGVPPHRLVNGAGGTATFTAPDIPHGLNSQTILLEMHRNGPPKRLLAQVSFDIIPPSTIKLSFIADEPPFNWSPIGGFQARIVVGPADVCFDSIDFRETAGPNTWVCTGICKNDPWYVRMAAAVVDVTTHLRHDPAQAQAGRREQVQQGDGIRHFDNANWENWCTGGVHGWTREGTALDVVDRVVSGYSPAQDPNVSRNEFAPKAFRIGQAVAGEGSLKIPVHYRVHGSADIVGRKFAEYTHHFTILKNGTLTIEKGGVRRTYPWVPPP